MIFRAEDRTEILDALKIAADLKLKAVISGGAEAWKVADALKAAKVPVLVGGTLRLPTEATDPYDAGLRQPGPAPRGRRDASRSSRAAPTWGPPRGTCRMTPPWPPPTACPTPSPLRAVTLAPAEILGVADQLGSLEVGKRANLVLTAGHVLQPTTEVKGLFLAGKPLTPESRHTRLYAKYRGRLAEVRAGTAPLGIDADPGSAATRGPRPRPRAGRPTVSDVGSRKVPASGIPESARRESGATSSRGDIEATTPQSIMSLPENPRSLREASRSTDRPWPRAEPPNPTGGSQPSGRRRAGERAAQCPGRSS